LQEEMGEPEERELLERPGPSQALPLPWLKVWRTAEPVAERLLAVLEAAGAQRCAGLREQCAGLECRLASAAEQTKASVGLQVEALSKLESTFDQIIQGVGPLFSPA